MLWTRRFPFWLRCRRCSRFLGWVAAISWWSSYGHSFLLLPAVQLLNCAGRGTKEWFVSVNFPYIIRIGSGELRKSSQLSMVIFFAVIIAEWSVPSNLDACCGLNQVM